MKNYQPQEEAISLQHHHILLAEDDLDDQELLKEAFLNADPSFVLHIEHNGKNALDYLDQLHEKALPSVIILDYNMPELNGAQVLEKLYARERYRSIPKVVLSTSNNYKYVEESLSKGTIAYRVKPYDFSDLVAIAREMIHFCRKSA